MKHSLVLLSGAVIATTACGSTSLAPEPPGIEGVWRQTEAGVAEQSIRFSEEGTFQRVAANLTDLTCASSSGTWRLDGTSLTLDVTVIANESVSRTESYSITVDGSGLSLAGGASAGTYGPRTSIPSCVDYGFGVWDGSLSAEVDGVDVMFAVVDVDIDVEGGSATIVGEDLTCSSCPDGRREILLRIEGQPDPLLPGTFTVNNDPGASDTFYALYHPDPGSAAFTGFDTTRLAPPGTFELLQTGPERIEGRFDFRANPRVEGEVGPNGETFVMVAGGVVDLTYR